MIISVVCTYVNFLSQYFLVSGIFVHCSEVVVISEGAIDLYLHCVYKPAFLAIILTLF